MLYTCIYICEDCCCKFTETVDANDRVPVFDKEGRIVDYKDVRCPQCGSDQVTYVETYSVG